MSAYGFGYSGLNGLERLMVCEVGRLPSIRRPGLPGSEVNSWWHRAGWHDVKVVSTGVGGIDRLVELDPATGLWHGNVLRLPAKWPYEDLVDFMVFETLIQERSFGLIVTTGHKAGLILVQRPAESVMEGDRGLSVRWVTENWGLWIYPDCVVDDVYVLPGYEPAVGPAPPGVFP